MSKYKKLIESIFYESDFIAQLKNDFGITDKMDEGGLVLPNGELIQMSNSDGVNTNDSTIDNSYSDIHIGIDDNFNEKILDDNIVKYCLKNDEPKYILLPSLTLADEQKTTIQELIRHCGEGISIILDGPLGFISVRATIDSSLSDILFVMKNSYNKLYNSLMTEADKEYKSKKVFDKDSGYNISKDEEYYYDLIKKKWPDAEKSKTFEDFRNPENHRPWQVDIYIPSEKTMIMIQKNWKHGRRPYNPNDPDCQSDVEWLKQHDGEFYDKVLYTWTKLDPLKRKIAKQLGYKYVEIFNVDEFNDWYKNPNLTYNEYKHPVKLEYDSDEYFKQKANHKDIYGNDSDPFAP